MIAIRVNVIDSQVNSVMKAVEESGICNLVHRSDVKVYVRDPNSKSFYAMDEEQLIFYLDSKCSDFEEKMDKLINIIRNSTTDKFLELVVNSELDSDEVERVLKGTLNELEFKELCTDAIQVRWK